MGSCQKWLPTLRQAFGICLYQLEADSLKLCVCVCVCVCVWCCEVCVYVHAHRYLKINEETLDLDVSG